MSFLQSRKQHLLIYLVINFRDMTTINFLFLINLPLICNSISSINKSKVED